MAAPRKASVMKSSEVPFTTYHKGKVKESPDETPASVPVIPKPRAVTHDKRAKVAGRKAFAGNSCEEHGSGCIVVDCDTQHECAKFGHLPGRGKGIHQPGVFHILTSSFRELLKPFFIMALLVGGLYGTQHVLSGNFLRPNSHVSKTTSRMSDGSEHKKNVFAPGPSVKPCRWTVGNSCSIHVSKNVKP